MFNRSFWVYGRSTRCALLSFDDQSVYGVRVYSGISWNCPIHKVGEGFLVTAKTIGQVPKKPPSGAQKSPPKAAGGAAPRAAAAKKGKKPQGMLHPIPYKAFRWHRQLPARIRAMALARVPAAGDGKAGDGGAGSGKTLFVAGPPDVIDAKDPYAALEGRRGGRCWALSAADGEVLSECALPSPPVFDGLIVAFGRVYMSTVSGRLVCLGKENR
jgi:hypothetical protein